MIKLCLPEKPAQLTSAVQKELTDKFLNDNSDVWNKPFIREAVANISFGKCCYSECKLNEESKYLEIDHFYPKKYFPEKVVEWGNLLPACKKCNTTKGEHNPNIEPIINPFVDNPQDHLYIENFRFYGKTEKGKTTIDVVALNDRKHFVDKRFKIGIKIIENIEDIKQSIELNINELKTNFRLKNRYLQRIKNLLNEGTKENEYAATISTVILQSEDFVQLIRVLKLNLLCDSELDNLIYELKYCSLIKIPLKSL